MVKTGFLIFMKRLGGGCVMRIKSFVGFIVCLLVVGVASSARSEIISNFMDKINPFENLELAGYFKNETAGGFSEGHDELMKFKNIADLKANYKFADWLEFYTNINVWYDAAFDIEERFHDLSHKEKNIKLRMPIKTQWLRECFFDIYTDRLDMRLGKQQVVWGTTDGVRILDMVNPLDYREWTLKPYSEIRIPLWMLKLEGELMMNGHLQLLLIPDYEPNYYAPAGSPFALRTVVAGAESASKPFVTVTTIDDSPERTPENTKIGLRWRNVIETGIASGLEYTLNYLHTYDFASSAYTATRINFVPFGIQVKLTRRSEQIDIFGGSFSKSITKGIIGDFGKGWTVRGEFAYITHGAMNYGTDYNIVGTVDVDQYNYALGFDKSFLTNWDFSFQFIQLNADAQEQFDTDKYTLLFGPTRGPLDKTETILTCKISTDFMHDRLKPEILLIYTDDDDWRISPKVNFEINDNWMITAGMHIFDGEPQHLNGQFDDNDQVFVETKYSW
ncbi:MAG: DUF1302 family protein [Candidatus Omnitrophica bacterium]|nr:DUF1302 family protein [Candidatus Omnitrophota bacterium]